MPFEPMGISGAFIFTPVRHEDERGRFQEMFKISTLAVECGIGFDVKQVNQSVSAKGVVRGIHFAAHPQGQAKYVSCSAGRVWDVVVDIRVGSPTFGRWESVELSSENGKSVLIMQGLGHAFLALDDGAVVNYLCSEEYDPQSERQIHPLDYEVGIPFSSMLTNSELILSEQDKNAPGLLEAISKNLLPRHN